MILVSLAAGARASPPEAASGAPYRVLSLSQTPGHASPMPAPEFVVQSGHTHAVRACAFSPDGTLLATAGIDGKVKLWDLRLGREIRTLSGQAMQLLTVAFRPDGRQVAAAGMDQSIAVWDVSDGHEVTCLKGHNGPVENVAFSPSGLALASASSDQTAVLWDLQTAAPRHVLEHGDRVQAVAWSPDGTTLATRTARDVRLWKVADGQIVRTLPAEGIGRPAFDPAGRWLAVPRKQDTELYDARTWTAVRKLSGIPLGFRGTDRALAILERPGTITFVDPQTGRKLETIQTASRESSGWGVPDERTAFSADGRLLACGTAQATVGVWDGRTGGRIYRLGERSNVTFGLGGGSAMRPLSIAWSPASPVFAVGDRDVVRLVDLRNGAAPRVLTAHHGLVTALAFSPNGKTLATGSFHGRDVRLWEVETGNAVTSLDAGEMAGGIEVLAFASPGRLVAGHETGPDGTAHATVWEIPSGRRLHELRDRGLTRNPRRMLARGGKIAGLGFLDGGKTLLTVHSYDNRLSRWDLATGQQLGSAVVNRTLIHGMAVRPNGRALALATGMVKEANPIEGIETEPLVRLLHSEGQGKWQLDNLEGHTQAVLAVAFSPDGKLLASGAADATVRLWDPERRTPVAALAGHTADVGSLAFSHDGRLLASAGYDQSVRLWDVAQRRLLAAFVSLGREGYVMVTPDNYYTASREGLRGVAFRIGNRAIPFEQFDLRFNRPDIVLSRIGYADPELVRSYERAFEQRLRRMNVPQAASGADLNPPTLELLAVPPLSTTERRLRLRVRAADPRHRLAKLLAYVNDVPAWGTGGADLRPLAATQAELEVAVELSGGSNKVQLSVLNDQGIESLSQTLAVACQAPPRKPDLYVLAIGVSRYRDPRLALHYAAKDAGDVAAFFERQRQRFGAVHVQRLLDGEVTREAVQQARGFLAGSATDDEVVVFLAGHGVLEAGRDYYFGTADIDLRHPAIRGLSYADVERLLDGIPARRKLLLIDTCHSGEPDADPDANVPIAAGPRPPDPPRSAPGIEGVRLRSFRGLVPAESDRPGVRTSAARNLLGELFADLRRGTGAVVIASAAGSEFALESARWQNGAFTYAVLEGLADRKADLNGDGQVQVSELQEYVSRRVRELTAGRQTPSARRENLELDFPVY